MGKFRNGELADGRIGLSVDSEIFRTPLRTAFGQAPSACPEFKRAHWADAVEQWPRWGRNHVHADFGNIRRPIYKLTIRIPCVAHRVISERRYLGRHRCNGEQTAERSARRHLKLLPISRPAALQLPITEFAYKAAVVSDDRAGAVLTARDMAAERRAAARDRTHHLQLVTEVLGIGLAPRRPVLAKDIGDLQRWAAHGRGLLGRQHWRNGVTASFHGATPVSDEVDDPRSSRQRGPPAIDNL
jgi:hypothetical protein